MAHQTVTIPCIVLQDLFYCSDTTRGCRPTIAVHLWLRKPFSQKSYSLDSMHAKSKIYQKGALIVRTSVQNYFFAYHILPLTLMLCGKCAITYVFCIGHLMTIQKKNALTLIMCTLCQMGIIFFVMEKYNACHLSICSQHFKKQPPFRNQQFNLIVSIRLVYVFLFSLLSLFCSIILYITAMQGLISA